MDEEDIKILEGLKEALQGNIDLMDRENKTFFEGMTIFYKKRIQAIENLITRNKQLETEKQNLIKKLEEANKSDTETVRYYEKMYKNPTNIFYKKSYKRTIDMANARRETRKNILEILKGVKNEGDKV